VGRGCLAAGLRCVEQQNPVEHSGFSAANCSARREYGPPHGGAGPAGVDELVAADLAGARWLALCCGSGVNSL